jgi:hypothetical protein
VTEQTTASKSIEITIVVSGQPERLKAGPHEKLEHLVREALKRSDNEAQPPGTGAANRERAV